MKLIDRLALILVVIGGLNWGCVGIFGMDLVAAMFGGSNVGNLGEVWTQDIPWQNRQWSLNIKLPPLAAVFFRLER